MLNGYFYNEFHRLCLCHHIKISLLSTSCHIHNLQDNSGGWKNLLLLLFNLLCLFYRILANISILMVIFRIFNEIEDFKHLPLSPQLLHNCLSSGYTMWPKVYGHLTIKSAEHPIPKFTSYSNVVWGFVLIQPQKHYRCQALMLEESLWCSQLPIHIKGVQLS